MKNRKLRASLALLILTVVIVGGAIISRPKSNAPMSEAAVVKTVKPAPKPVPQKAPATGSLVANTSTYKDGTYTATGSYASPGGVESLKVTLTLADDGIVTGSTVKSETSDPTAATYQSYFISNYKRSVIGKSVTAIKLNNISGSSLTSQGFKDALKQIERKAKA